MAADQSFNIQYPIRLFGQPTKMTCWSAATTMLFGTQFSAGPGAASLSPTGGLQIDKSRPGDQANIQAFARSYNLHLYFPQCWTVAGLVNLLRRGPVSLAGPIPTGHVVVIGGIRGDGTPGGTELNIYDPWPPNVGRNYSIIYEDFMSRFPMATMYLLQR